MQDCVAVASECVNLLDKKFYSGNVALKVDIKKAFGMLDWTFLGAVLKAFGFSSQFCSWILVILYFVGIYVLFNSCPYGYFDCSQGVPQGDPWSPILFNVVEDFLSRLILIKVMQHEFIPMLATRCSSAPNHFVLC